MKCQSINLFDNNLNVSGGGNCEAISDGAEWVYHFANASMTEQVGNPTSTTSQQKTCGSKDWARAWFCLMGI
jgi:hypothetical protein